MGGSPSLASPAAAPPSAADESSCCTAGLRAAAGGVGGASRLTLVTTVRAFAFARPVGVCSAGSESRGGVSAPLARGVSSAASD
eukprot:3518669-Prymnesium_polylepis.1